MNSQVDKYNRQERLPRDIDSSMILMWLTKKSWLKNKKYDKATKMNSYDIDKLKKKILDMDKA
jgi:hypothetical protein